MENEHWSDPRHRALVARVERICRETLPRNVERMLGEVVAPWKTLPRSRARTTDARALRATMKRLKTDHAIRRWLYDEAPLAQLLGARASLGRLIVTVYDLRPDDPEFGRLSLKLGRRYPLRDAILSGLELWEASL